MSSASLLEKKNTATFLVFSCVVCVCVCVRVYVFVCVFVCVHVCVMTRNGRHFCHQMKFFLFDMIDFFACCVFPIGL